ncbi:vitamin K epoxide reductase family protein [uncultured Jatrophihabitans sp.]|uniref:vitamin K epoxide reductase family protein n=1 Tax=uncultured Jatrophihabitans sp. TaxID=1610747 RepID=UPI0035CA75C6
MLDPRRRPSGTSTDRPRVGASGLVALAFAGAGLGVSTYLTVEHYDSSVTLSCPESATINCAKVTTSSWSHVGPIPVALLGLMFFVAMTVLCLPAVLRIALLDRVRVVGALFGTASVLYLVGVELLAVDAICLWCTVVHICTVGLLVTILWRASSTETEATL